MLSWRGFTAPPMRLYVTRSVKAEVVKEGTATLPSCGWGAHVPDVVDRYNQNIRIIFFRDLYNMYEYILFLWICSFFFNLAWLEYRVYAIYKWRSLILGILNSMYEIMFNFNIFFAFRSRRKSAEQMK